MKKNYLKKVFKFYFTPSPIWQSFLAIFYLLFFLYFAVFYVGNIWLALKFIFYTIVNSGVLLGLSYLFWGVIFLISLIVPFSISLYSVLLLYEIWKKDWKRADKVLGTLIILALVPFVIIVMDEVVRIAVSQGVLTEFAIEHNLNILGR